MENTMTELNMVLITFLAAGPIFGGIIAIITHTFFGDK